MKIRITKQGGGSIEVTDVVEVQVVEGQNLQVSLWNQLGARSQTIKTTGQGFFVEAHDNCQGLRLTDPALPDPRPEVGVG